MRAPDTFETERLRLRPVRAGDAGAVFAYAGAVAATRYMDFSRHRTPAESEAFTARCVRAWAAGSAFAYAIEAKTGGEAMGVIELRLSPPKADFGYILAESHWGRGFASEAARAIADWAVAQAPIHRVWATCHPDNAASGRVLRKAGLAKEATLAAWTARPQLGEAAGAAEVYARLKQN